MLIKLENASVANMSPYLQLLQLKLAGKRIVQYGDDTWIKLFPGAFLRAEGTSSFFVADYTEVDNNVTRHSMCVIVCGILYISSKSYRVSFL